MDLVSRTLVIPAAGRGTRMAPMTDVVPKELLPVFDKPAIHLILEEAIAAQLDRVIIVRSPSKPQISSYLRDHVSAGSFGAGSSIEIIDVVQESPTGMGAAVLLAEPYVDEARFAVMLPDGLFTPPEAGLPAMLKIAGGIDTHLIGLKETTPEEARSSGVVITEPGSPGMPGAEQVHEIVALVEKPRADLDRYKYMILGRYILGRDIFHFLREAPESPTGEIDLTIALSLALGKSQVYGMTLRGRFRDVGTPAGLVSAAVDRARLAGVEFSES